MSVYIRHSIPSKENVELVPYAGPYGGPPGTHPDIAGAIEPEGVPWARYIDALKRHIFLIAVVVLTGTAIGLFAVRRVRPVYDAQAKVWIGSGSSLQGGGNRTDQLLPATSWIELLQSYSIVEPVVYNLRLNVHYKAADSVFFTQFESLPSLRPGQYVVQSDATGRYRLSSQDITIERGTVGDSIGRKVGFGWAPDARLFSRGRTISFSVSTPRATAMGLLASERTTFPENSQFLTITLSGPDPERTASTLNAWVDQFVASAVDLKKRHLLEFKRLLGEQLSVAESQLRAAETQLERFRVNTITLPTAALTGPSGDPAFTAYFQQKTNLSEVQSERLTLEQIVADAKGGPLNPQGFLLLPTILNNTPQLRIALDELSSREAALRTEKQFLTDANPRVKQLTEAVRVLEYETIPQIVQSVLETLRTRERDLNANLANGSAELKAIPSRTIEETRLARQVSASENLYTGLKARYEEVSLAVAQTSPDLSVLDRAVPPTRPNSNDAPRLLLLAFLASIGLAGAIAILHDRIDRRFRYPEQAIKELGLAIVGTVPRLRPKRSGEFQIELMSQVVESFRTLRLAVRYDYPRNAPVVLSVSSPSANDGKSLVSSNLALAFAGAGNRTLLIDGDVRRGTQHGTFEVQVTPGLVEYLADTGAFDKVVKPTATENLFLLPRGARASRAPELLVSDRMNALIQEAREKFDVVIIDSPPFIAGVDAYALAAAAGNILVVLRQGVSDRKLAAAKLAIVDRLPIRFLGVVVNGVPSGGMYRDYGTDYSGEGSIASAVGSIATPRGLVVGA